MKRSTALLRITFALLLLAAVFRMPVVAQTCTSCLTAYSCAPCEDGGKRLCKSTVCCGVTTGTTCGICTLHCILPPSS